MGPKSCFMRNDSRNQASLEESVQDMVGNFKYLEGYHITELDLSRETPTGIISIMHLNYRTKKP